MHLLSGPGWRCAWLALLVLITACADPSSRSDVAQTLATPVPLVWPKPPAQERIRYIKSVTGPADWGLQRSFWQRAADSLSGRSDQLFIRPSAVVERAGVLAVADPGAQALWILDGPRERFARVTHVAGEGLVSPVGLALGPDESFFLADTALKKVLQIGRDGTLLRTFATQGLERPAGVVWDTAAQRLFVLDSLKHRVAVFDADGKLLRNMGGSGNRNGQFNHPTHLALDTSAAVARLLITDALNFRVQALSENGAFQWKFGQSGNGGGDFAAPKGLASDSAGHIYVVDALFDLVQIFDQQGQLLLAFGEHGGARGQFALPGGIFISTEDRVYVADAYNRRVQVFLGAIATAAAIKEGAK